MAFSGTVRPLGQALIRPPELIIPAYRKSTREMRDALRNLPKQSRPQQPSRQQPVKPKYAGAQASHVRWPLPPGAARIPLDETSFGQLIVGFQSSWLEAKDYHTRLAVHRNPAELKKQLAKEIKDYIKMIRERPEMLISTPSFTNPVTVGSVPDEIGKLWLSDRRIRTLYRATLEVCSSTAKGVVRSFGLVAPHVAEYRAMINLVKRLEHAPKEKRPPKAAKPPSPYKPPSSALSDERYFEIIDYIIQLGKDFENYPDLNENFNEERYRSYFLPFLNSVSPNYSAKGEVFHRKGKTDILVWDKAGNNLFIAECKIWKGEAYLLDGLIQLLDRYVNWRDEKAALIVFSRDIKDFTGVIRTATTALSNHALCKKPGRKRNDCSWSYWFHHPNDSARTIRLELILLNFV